MIVAGFGHSADDPKKLAPTIPQAEGKKVTNGTIAVTFPSPKTLWKADPQAAELAPRTGGWQLRSRIGRLAW